MVRRELLSAVRKAARPAKDAAKVGATCLPGGHFQTGLRADIAAAITVRTRTTGHSAGVQIVVPRGKLGSKDPMPELMNKGSWRHPVFGNKAAWAEQTSTADWWSTSIMTVAPEVSATMRLALARISAQIGATL